MKNCQFCAEAIQDAAIVCKHCGHELSSEQDSAVPASPPASTEPPSPAPSEPAQGRAQFWAGTTRSLGLASGKKRHLALGLVGIGLIAGWLGADAEGPGGGIFLLPIGVVVLLTGRMSTRVFVAFVAFVLAWALFLPDRPDSAPESTSVEQAPPS